MTCLDEEIIDHFESSLFSQDEDVRADNDPLAWEDIEGCHVSENYAEEVQGVDCNVDEFFGDTFYDNLDERAVDGINELRYMNLKEITASEVRLLHFWDRTVSFSFYQLYSKMNGFAVRKNKIRRNVKNESPLHALERSAFRPMLSRACTLKVRSCTLTPSCEIYTLSRSGNPNKEWNVSQYRDRSIFKCSCFRMESLGIPCDHIVAVLVHLDAEEIPKSLLIDRWSKNVRSKVWEFMENGPFCWESMRTCRNWTINDMCREICVLDPLVKPNLMS
ncbi:hypothetical protein HN51_048152 [Arachis hypogaea]